MRGLILATQFLTRLPVPAVADFREEDLARSAVWFPLVGIIIGTCVALFTLWGAHIDAWLGAWMGLLCWVAITGALHLDGLADLADGLGASHRDPERLLAVMKDPHIGVFGIVVVFMLLSGKLVLLWLWLTQGISLFALLLVCAWSRWGSLVWARLPSLHAGHGERFQWQLSGQTVLWTGVALFLCTLLFSPALWLAPVMIAGWRWFLQRSLGGMSGDCLGAGTELCECALLLLPLLH